MFTTRTTCIFCSSNNLKTFFEQDYTIPLRNCPIEKGDSGYHRMPYNVQLCNSCKTVQTKYIGDLSIIYGDVFAGAYGSIRSSLNTTFAELIHKNAEVGSIIEIGAGNGELSQILLEKKDYLYTIIDPSYNGPANKRRLLAKFFEEVDLSTISCDTVVMSHVFEHFYNPTEIIAKLRNIPQLKFVHIALPDFDSFIEDGTYHVLNPEHTFYVTKQFITDVFKYYGFKLNTLLSHEKHSIFYEFEKVEMDNSLVFPSNLNTEADTMAFFNRLFEHIKSANLHSNHIPTYIWPASMHTIFASSMGLDKEQIVAVLDNSPLKINKFLNELPILAFNEVIQTNEKKLIILAGGCYNKEIFHQASKNSNNTVVII